MKIKTQDQIYDNCFVESNSQNVNIDRQYEKPVLLVYGDVRDITLGPTVGEGESGCALFFRSGAGGCPPI